MATTEADPHLDSASGKMDSKEAKDAMEVRGACVIVSLSFS